MEASFALPGTKLGTTSDLRAGLGAYERDGQVFSSLTGIVHLEEAGQKRKRTRDDRPEVSVQHYRGKSAAAQVPTVGQIIMGRVTRVSSSTASLDIVVVDDEILNQPCSGVIRTEDVYPAGLDIKIELYRCFKLGDVVRARILSLGDARQYYLSTAEPECGVTWTRSASGSVMLPVAWNEVACLKSGATEARKCAKP